MLSREPLQSTRNSRHTTAVHCHHRLVFQSADARSQLTSSSSIHDSSGSLNIRPSSLDSIRTNPSCSGHFTPLPNTVSRTHPTTRPTLPSHGPRRLSPLLPDPEQHHALRSDPVNTAKLSSPILLQRTVSYDAATK